MEATLSTFGAMAEKFEQPAVETTTTEQQSTQETTETTTESQTETTTEQVQETTSPQEENVSSFSLGITEEEIPIVKPETKEAARTFNWKEEIKKLDRKEVAKELGFEDFELELDEYVKKGGKRADYITAKSIDYNQISDEDLIKEDLRKQYPKFDKEKIDKLFDMNYGESDLDTQTEKENKSLRLEADAYIKRQQKIAEQQKFVIPETPILPKDEAYEQWKQQRESQPQLMEQLRSFYDSHEATKALNESKRVAVNLGEGVAPFNFSIDRPDLITQMWTDGGELANKLMTTKSGEPDVAKQQLIALFSFNPQRFIQDIFAYGQKMGVRKELVEEGQNAVRPQAKVLPVDQNQKPTYSAGKFADRQR